MCAGRTCYNFYSQRRILTLSTMKLCSEERTIHPYSIHFDPITHYMPLLWRIQFFLFLSRCHCSALLWVCGNPISPIEQISLHCYQKCEIFSSALASSEHTGNMSTESFKKSFMSCNLFELERHFFVFFVFCGNLWEFEVDDEKNVRLIRAKVL